MESQVIGILDYLRDIVEGASKVPITGKVVVDRKEVLELLDQVINCLPDEIKKAQWVLGEKERILAEARKENESVKQETYEMISTTTFLFSLIAAAFTTVLIALAILPCFPITFPISSGDTFSSNMIDSSPKISFTWTSSGLSTSDLAIISTNSFILFLLKNK